jgi:aryl-alcohol dehydrogenase-like predicted oxidoreductase
MLTLQKQGKIRAFGISVSDHRADEANGVIEAGRVAIVEAPYSVLDQRAAERLFPLAERHKVSIIARCPLASGALAGTWYPGMKFHRDDWRRQVFRGEVLEQILRRVDEFKALVDPTVPLAQIALRFCLSHPAVTAVIPGVRSAEQARCNLEVLGQDALPEVLLDQIEQCWHEVWHRQVRTSIGEEGEGEQRAAGARQAMGSPSRP